MNTRSEKKARRTVPPRLSVVFMGSGLGPFGPPRNDAVIRINQHALATRPWSQNEVGHLIAGQSGVQSWTPLRVAIALCLEADRRRPVRLVRFHRRSGVPCWPGDPWGLRLRRA